MNSAVVTHRFHVVELIAFALIIVSCVTKPTGASENINGCFVRDYGKAHLSSHPNQLVTHVKLSIRSAARGSTYSHDFSLQVKMRGRNELLGTEGACQKRGPQFHCFVECDGGGIEAAPHPGYAMMYLDRIRMITCSKAEARIGRPGKESEELEVTGGIDDREFRINRVRTELCGDTRIE